MILAVSMGLLLSCVMAPPSTKNQGGSEANGSQAPSSLPKGFSPPFDKHEPRAGGGCASQPLPGWVTNEPSVGESTRSREAAEASARERVIKNMEVQLSSELKALERETTGGKFTYSVESLIVEKVDLSIAGLEIRHVLTDACRGKYYALAILDVSKAVNAWTHDLREVESAVMELQQQVKASREQGHVFQQIVALFRLIQKEEVGEKFEKRLVYLTKKPLPGDLRSGNVMHALHEYESALDSVSLQLYDGNRQKAQYGRPLQQPLVVEVMAALPQGKVPIAGFPVQFAFQTGSGAIDPAQPTNAQGLAKAIVTRVEPAQSSVTVMASVAWTRMPFDLDTRIQADLKQRLSPIAFTVRPPWGCQTDDPFEDGLFKVACQLVAGVDESLGRETVVKEFIWTKSRKRIELSRQMEHYMAKGLALTGVLQMVQQDSQEHIPANVRAIVSGEFGFDAQKGLWIDARLVRKATGHIEAVLPHKHYIPRSAVPRDALEMMGESSRDQPVTPIPVPGSSQPFADWVEQFWNTENPEAGFRTELHPGKSAYPVGENAMFRFTTTQDCYLTLVNIGTSGKWTLLLPNPYQPHTRNTLVRAGTQGRMFPSPEDGFEFTVGPPLGSERIKAICTTKPIAIITGINLDQTFFSLSVDTPKWRDLQVTKAASSDQTFDWSSAKAGIDTIAAGQHEPAGKTMLRSRGLVIR